MSADIYAEVKIRPTLIFMNNDSNMIFLDNYFNQICCNKFISTFCIHSTIRPPTQGTNQQTRQYPYFWEICRPNFETFASKTSVINHEKVKVCHGKINHCNNHYRPKVNVKLFNLKQLFGQSTTLNGHGTKSWFIG